MRKTGVRMCSVFYCDQRGDRYCCADCVRAYRCDNRCLNDPKRCNLEDKSKQPRNAEK